MEHAELTGRIIGAAIEVHTRLGPGFLETVYESAFAIELGLRDLRYERQRVVPVVYRGIEVASHRLDFFVEDEIVVELKAVRLLVDEHFAVVRSYLVAAGRRHGLLLNFAQERLEIRRVMTHALPRCPLLPPLPPSSPPPFLSCSPVPSPPVPSLLPSLLSSVNVSTSPSFLTQESRA